MLTLDCARKIARDWNTVDEAPGFVTRFTIDQTFAARYPVQTVGGRASQELWIPAGEVAELNEHIVGRIEVVEAYTGPRFVRSIDAETHLPVDLGS